MKMVYHNILQKTEEYQTAFGGYNRTDNCSELEFYDMKNMTSDLFPILSPRKKRDTLKLNGEKKKAILAKDKLCHVADRTFYIDNVPVQDFDIEPKYDENENEKQIRLISMGAYVLIFPQNLFVNTVNITDRGTIKKEFSLSAVMLLCDREGTAIFANSTDGYPSTEEEGKDDGYYVTHDEEENPVLMKNIGDEWIETESYFFISNLFNVNFPEKYGEADFSLLAPGSNVILSGFGELNLDGKKAIENIALSSKTGNLDDRIVFRGFIPHNATQLLDQSGQKLTTIIPNMDFVIESGNRLWGCRYGGDTDGNFVNEIYASKLGDFTVWESFQGSASDSYKASVGSDGPFTGAARYDDKPIFFKENCFHRVYGTLPENYQIQLYENEGIQKGSDRSAAIVENVLFYKGTNGFYAFNGTIPQKISDNLGTNRMYSAVGGSCNKKYYVSAKDKDGRSNLFVYDIEKNLWHKEDDTELISCADRGSVLYCISEKADFVISPFGEIEEDLSWYAETGIIGKSTPDKKVVQRLKIRAELESSAMVQVLIEYDSSGNYEPIFFMEGRIMQSYSIPVRVHRCDHFRILFMGRGMAKIYSLSKVVAGKGDR